MEPNPTDTGMEPTVTDTDDPVDKLMIPLLPPDTATALIVTLPLTPLVPALNVVNIITLDHVSVSIPDDIVRPPTKPVGLVLLLTNTSPPVVEPTTDVIDRSPSLPPVNIPTLTFIVPLTPLSPEPTNTVLEPPVLYTYKPSSKIMIQLLPYNASPVLIVTLPLTPLVPALSVFNSSATEVIMPPPNPFFHITLITDTAIPVVEPAPDSKYRSSLLPPYDDPAVKEASSPGAGEKLHPNLPSQGKTTGPNSYPTDSGQKLCPNFEVGGKPEGEISDPRGEPCPNFSSQDKPSETNNST